MPRPSTRHASQSSANLDRSNTSQRLGRHLYRFSLFSFITLVIVVLLGATYDVGQQIVSRSVFTHDANTRAGDIIITGGAYVLLAILAVIISISRLISVRQIMASIPKAYVPIQKHDVPKPVQEMISREYARCALIGHLSQPKSRRLEGWGAPGTPYEGVQFRPAILETTNVLDSVLGHLLPAKNPDEPLRFPTVQHRNPSQLAKFRPLFFPPSGSTQKGLLPKTVKPLIAMYEKHLQRARYEVEEPTVEMYEDCLRILATIVDLAKKQGVDGWRRVEED